MKAGKILLVGIGPGAHEHMTFRAREAIAEADVVIGYSTYIKLVEDLLEGKEVIKKGMTEELDRSIEAYEYAKKGKIVALVSSGDIGVYGMAGPTYEFLLESGWTRDSEIEVEVVAGSTALSSCAALVGAPLTHDFCAISLSDLLTPWTVIANRLESAAKGDFVVALYNPKSGRRTQHIVQAQKIMLRYRSPQTPVAIVKSGYRKLQNVQLVTLAEMADCDIGMLTTVLIGNSSTFTRNGLMVTPRGYANKYDKLSGETLSGEKAGRSLSMGLEGWHSCVRRYLRENSEVTLLKTAEFFNRPIGEILEAVTQANEEDLAGNFSAQEKTLDELFLLAQNQIKIRAVVRNDSDAVAEIIISGENLKLQNNRLSLETEPFHLHIDFTNVTRGFLIERVGKSIGLQFIDKHGQSAFNVWFLD